MCLGDIRLMPWVTAKLVEATLTSTWSKILDPSTVRVAILPVQHETTDYRVMFGGQQPSSNDGFVIPATGGIRTLFKFDELGRLVQLPLWGRVATGTITVKVLVLETTQEIMERIRSAGLLKPGDTKL